uniref:UPF0577 protein KIAA1324-like n=1 Tax=Saccoglossus kowalevskii TaxID=10224 RepID=A0ABM0MZS6_SACKO|nr:PREDICTED: UPF0577 protein KIAA1324-like [Saccoglossus kowalevskii]
MKLWLIRLAVFIACVFDLAASANKQPTCQPDDFHYQFTECDSDGVRWRVSVPDPDACTGGAPPPPVRAPDCGFSCGPGEYLDVEDETDLSCKKCPTGTYSLGGGVRYQDWSQLPVGFSLLSESVSDGWMESKSNCNQSQWHPMGNFIASAGDDCSSMLLYTANLKKPGSVSFTYQYSDDDTIFHVYAQNDQCQTLKDTNANRWPQATGDGEWKKITMSLKSGLNVIYWKTMGVDFETSSRKKKSKPVLIREIEVMGIAYTSECTKCPNGTFSKEEGSIYCEQCPENTFSESGQSECKPCLAKQYSAAGAAVCIERKPCTAKDYFEVHGPCDENKQTQLMYKWIAPKICSDGKGAVALPTSGKKEDCPPCNPGMSFYNNTHCQFCPENQFSNGENACKTCPASTAPIYGMEFKWWNTMPPNLDTSCLSVSDYGCPEDGFVLFGDHIQSSQGSDDDAYLILSLHTDGFRSASAVYNGKPGEVGRVTFVFELICSGDCGFYFMEEDDRDSDVIESWEKSMDKFEYSYSVTKSGPRTFSWAFQKTNNDDYKRDAVDYRDDMAKIYLINVTNTVDGGASVCKPCPRGSDVKGCIPCPPGHYIPNNSDKCKACPAGTYIQAGNPFVEESCLDCGPGTTSHNGTVCESDCHYISPTTGSVYDFSPLKEFRNIMSAPSFTAKGTRYYHLFNVSLCGNHGNGKAVCRDNVTYYSENSEDNVTSMVCRSTIIPSGENEAPMSAQPVITEDRTFNNITVSGFEKDSIDLPDINFYYNSAISTTACPNGRSSVISLRCDITAPDNGVVELPTGCPDGTCDGCTFHFLWRSHLACPLCTENDFKSIEENCKGGIQTIHYVWKNQPKNCRDGASLPDKVNKKCPMLTFEAQIAITVAVGCAALLIALIVYFWKKTRKLEYKYQRLVQSSSGKDGELPTVDSCAVDEGDEDEVIFNDGQRKSGGLFSKFKSAVSSKDSGFQKKTLKELEEDDPLAMFE